MNVTLPVRPDGKISMPLLNDVQAAGMTPMQLAASITEKLKKYICRSAGYRGGDGDEQPANLRAGRSAAYRSHGAAART